MSIVSPVAGLPWLRRGALVAVFTLSGFSGLIYESIWTHYLKLFLGHAAYAQTLVLAIFMGGLAAGAWVSSRWSGRWNNLLRGYAIVEGVVGVCALVFHPLFDGAMTFAYAALLPAMHAPTAISATKWGLAAVLILPQSVLLGMTFPLMAGGFVRRFPDRPGAALAVLYFANSLGGALGVLASGFLLIRLLGLPFTIVLAGLVNLILAGFVWWVAGLATEPRMEAAIEGAPEAPRPAFHRLLLLVALLTGTASFIYEIGWIRMLSLVLGSSTHAFELMLSAFILGLACGGLWIRRRIDALAAPIAGLGRIQVAMGLLALSTLYLYGATFDVMRWLMTVLPPTNAGYVQFNLASHGIALIVMLPTTFCAGTTLPLITYALLRAGGGERSIGQVYAANTIGAIVGVLFAVHVGLPVLGLKHLIVAGAAVDLGLGCLLLWHARSSANLYAPLGAVALCAAAVALTLVTARLDYYHMASGVYRAAQGVLEPGRARFLFHQDGKTATVDVTETNGFVSIRTNGKIDASVNMKAGGSVAVDESTMVLTGALPLLLHPHARTAANIGLGSGLTTHVLLSIPTLVSVDTIEIEAAMVEGAKAFRPRNERVYADPRSRLHIEDAKSFFSTHSRTYDVIVSEPSNPWVSGVAGLFSEEFYRLVRRHLADGGLFVQWLQLYEFDLRLVASVFKALSPHFSDYAIYAPMAGDILIVASHGRPMPPLDPRAFEHPGLASELARVGVMGVQDLVIRRIADRRLLAPWVATVPVAGNSDYFPVIDQNAARARFLQRHAVDFVSVGGGTIPVVEILGGEPRTWTRTRITPHRAFPASLAAYRATLIRDLIRGEAVDGVEHPAAAREARQLLERCAEVTMHGDRRPIVFELGTSLSGFLRPVELREVWRHLETQPCATNLTLVERYWWHLFEALGDRNATAMAAGATRLLDQTDEPSERRDFLVAVALLGRLAGGGTRDARLDGARTTLPSAPDGRTKPGAWSLLLDVLAAASRPAS